MQNFGLNAYYKPSLGLYMLRNYILDSAVLIMLSVLISIGGHIDILRQMTFSGPSMMQQARTSIGSGKNGSLKTGHSIRL